MFNSVDLSLSNQKNEFRNNTTLISLSLLSKHREAYTLQLLNKFKSKLTDIKSSNDADDDSDSKANKGPTNEANDDELNSDKWMVNVFKIFSFSFLSVVNNAILITF